MEYILELYAQPYDSHRPMVCLDECCKQLVSETKTPIPYGPGRAFLYDYQYRRNGIGNIFMMFEPLAGKRQVVITDRRTRKDFAKCIRHLVDEVYPDAEKVVLVMDNLNTHEKSSLYEAFGPSEARRIARKLDIHKTPKHGSWLNMAEIELSVMGRQCLSERMGNIEHLRQEGTAWASNRNQAAIQVNWQFTTEDARIKLKRLYPSYD
jgi:hypothetical protein